MQSIQNFDNLEWADVQKYDMGRNLEYTTDRHSIQNADKFKMCIFEHWETQNVQILKIRNFIQNVQKFKLCSF